MLVAIFIIFLFLSRLPLPQDSIALHSSFPLALDPILPDEIMNLDLGAVVNRTQQEESWSAPDTTKHTMEYRRFLTLHQLYPLFPLVPALPIDKIWHNHILFTKMYANDCQTLFGSFMHHEPSSDTSIDPKPYLDTMQLYYTTFGVDSPYPLPTFHAAHCFSHCASPTQPPPKPN